MEFRKSDTARKDITGYDPSAGSTSLKRIHSENTALEYIEVYSDTNDIPVISYKLHHSYFFGKKEYNGSVIIDTTYLSARLKLDSITIQGKGAVQKYKMEYDMSDNFPLKNEYYTDKWGYYTDNNPLKIPYYHQLKIILIYVLNLLCKSFQYVHLLRNILPFYLLFGKPSHRHRTRYNLLPNQLGTLYCFDTKLHY